MAIALLIVAGYLSIVALGLFVFADAQRDSDQRQLLVEEASESSMQAAIDVAFAAKPMPLSPQAVAAVER